MMKANMFKRVAVVSVACVLALAFAADDAKPGDKDGDAAWQEVLTALRPPPPPAEWRTNEPTKEQIAAWEKKNGVLAGQAADKARDFYTKFPSHSKAEDARHREIDLLRVSIELGNTNAQARFDQLLEKRLNDPSVSADEKFELRAQRIAKLLMDDTSTNRTPALARAEKSVRELQSDFPKREEVFQMLLGLANVQADTGDLGKARSLAKEVAEKTTGEVQETAQRLIRTIDRVGKPFELKFVDLSGKKIDVKKYSGQVVLVDFWATWCGSCVAALPEVKEIYAKYHSKGFEILGVSFDKEKSDLTEFVAKENMSWPQYFDGSGWDNQIGTNYEITGLPTMWLIDKKGNLRDLKAMDGLGNKIEKLLTEK
jgi:thiol-disulfide isomerase/thioredoxin